MAVGLSLKDTLEKTDIHLTITSFIEFSKNRFLKKFFPQ